MFLPFAVPVLALCLVLAGVGNIFVLSIATLAYGGVPYVVFVFLAWRWMNGKTLRQLTAFGLLSPVIFAPFQVMFMLLLRVSVNGTALWRWLGNPNLRDCFEIVYFVLIFGYGYVSLALLGWGLVEILSRGRLTVAD